MTQLPTGTPPVRDLPVPPVEPVAPVAPVEGSAEYNTQVALSAPANIPDKFRKPDGTVDSDLLLKSYQAMEQMQRGVTPDPTAGVSVPSTTESLLQTPTVPPTGESVTPPTGTVEEILSQEKPAAPTVNWDAVRTGTVSEEDIANLKALGIPDDFVTQFAADRKAAKVKAIAEVADAVGGEESLAAVLRWAQKTKSAEEWNTLRAAVAKGDQSKILLMGLHAEFKAANPEATLIVPADGGVGPTTPAVEGYATQREMLADMGELDAQGRTIYDYSPVKQKQVALRIFLGNGGDAKDFEVRYKPSTDY